MALTFDDGFNVPACLSIVETLLAQGVAATFFPNGQYVRETPSFWHFVAANGFPVGDHGTTHNDPRTLAADALGLNLSSDRRIADAALGLPSIDAYRPPYGDYDLPVEQVAALEGYPVLVGWDVDSRDQSGVPSVAAEVADATTGIDGSIVLMHCGSRLTPLALPAIIARYRSRGFTFVTVPGLLGLGVPPSTWAPPSNPDAWPVNAPLPGVSEPSWNASPAIDQAGDLHLAYETPIGIDYAENTSGSWTIETVAPTNGLTFASRPSIALDPGGGVELAYLSISTSGTEVTYQHRSGEGIWSSAVPVAKLAEPASTATIAVDPSGQPIIAYASLGGAHQGIDLARPNAGGGWNAVHIPTTNGSFLNPSIVIDRAGSIDLVERRNGYPELDETTNSSGTWTTSRLSSIAGSAIPFVAVDSAGRLVVAVQQTYGPAISVGTVTNGHVTWSTVTAVGDLSGLALTPNGSPVVAFARVPAAGGPSRVWLADDRASPGPAPTQR